MENVNTEEMQMIEAIKISMDIKGDLHILFTDGFIGLLKDSKDLDQNKEQLKNMFCETIDSVIKDIENTRNNNE